MRLLLDTHTFLWFVWASPQLASSVRSLIEDTANQKFVSVAGLWELAVKVSIGKLTLAKPLDEFLVEHLEGNAFEMLSIERSHVAYVSTLPFHHRDPFDRMLVAQSLIETIPLLSADPIFDSYGITRLW
jgi:PIN domain nuclease of toxin-antitoxin system